jgi:hypothetical protein
MRTHAYFFFTCLLLVSVKKNRLSMSKRVQEPGPVPDYKLLKNWLRTLS